MSIKQYIADITIEIMQMGFKASIGENKDMVYFENAKGNKIYITNKGEYCTIHGYRQAASAFKQIRVDDAFSDYAELVTHIIAKAFKIY